MIDQIQLKWSFWKMILKKNFSPKLLSFQNGGHSKFPTSLTKKNDKDCCRVIKTFYYKF